MLSNPQIAVRRLAVAADSVVGPIAAYDLVRCEVRGLLANGRPWVSVCRVDGGGTLSAPLLPSIAVAGLTESGASAAVAKGYRAANIINDPQVSVLVLERAPTDAAHRSLPDGPINPVPEALRPLYEQR